MNLPNCTAVCLDTINHEQAKRAAEYCDRAAAFRDIFILSDRDTGFATKIVAEVRSLEDYNDFILHRLVDYCETEFVLIFQWDGFIIRPEEWSSEFMKYDYVGAPWLDEVGAPRVVGNGGFSLRSRRLLEACANARRPAGEYEDWFICRTFIPEHSDFTAAPVDVAQAFAVENSPWAGRSFGFHGSWHFPRFMADEDVIERLPLQTARFWETGQALRWIETAKSEGKFRLARSILETCLSLRPDATLGAERRDLTDELGATRQSREIAALESSEPLHGTRQAAGGR